MEDGSGYEDMLERFRKQWQQEIAQTASQCDRQIVKDVASTEGEKNSKPEDEERATTMYLQGVVCEESGHMVEAIKYYKRAMQLVPDIEQRVYRAQTSKAAVEEVNLTAMNTQAKFSDANEDTPEDGHSGQDLLSKLQQGMAQDGRLCSPNEETNATHISILPLELFVHLLKWVVSKDLDLRSLEQVALVCRGFYVCCRDAELWKSVCARAWNGIGNCGLAESRGFVNWRDMFINRPRLLYDGCYISKTSYSRPGENSFQDADYQPWHLVTYFRYLRFFADGTALMLTTADAPSTMLAHLKRKNGRHPALIRGIYSFHDTFVRVVFKRKNAAASKAPAQRHRKKRDTNNNDSCTVCEQTFELELEIHPHKRRLNWTLHWRRYSVITKYLNGSSSQCDIPVSSRQCDNPSRFPPLWFSRVKSYLAESENCL